MTVRYDGYSERTLEKRDLSGDFRLTEQGWLALVPDDVEVPGDSMEEFDCSTLWLLEDDVAIGPPHAVHQDITERGKGRYSHWQRALWFSTSDDSDPNTNGRRYTIAWQKPGLAVALNGASRSHPVLDILGDILRARNVTRISYFHADHFEPFSNRQSSKQWTEGLINFARLTAAGGRLASRLSLFYTPLIQPTLVPSVDPKVPDTLSFRYPTQEHLALCRDLIRPLEAEFKHEFHIHLHHEGWTASNYTFPALAPFVHGCASGRRDSESLDRYLTTCRATMEAELGREFSSWAFVHGNWALNACDPASCRVEDELMILKRHGCVGDFTFPAGAWRNDPVLKQPYTCETPSLPRNYDREEARPRPLSRGADDFGRDRFFVWNSDLDATRSSLDLYEPATLALLKQPEFILREWFARAPVIDGCLYIKTHAHSADDFYSLWGSDPCIPHTFGPVRALLDLFERAADLARLPLDPVSVGDVMSDLRRFDASNTTGAAPLPNPSLSFV